MSESISTFSKYQHVERFGTTEVEGILEGTCHVFPKIDGSNASVWWDAGVQCGSRRRSLSVGDDNAGFHAWIQKSEESNCIGLLLRAHPNLRLFGEWLVPHSLRTYRDNAWRKFYVFDVVDREADIVDCDDVLHVSYDTYQPLMKEYGVDYIPCMAVVENALGYDFNQLLPQNDFLMQPGHSGEGIVIKNYGFRNKFGRQTWAKIVSSEFKENNQKIMGPTGESVVEIRIADTYVTLALCEKVRSKIAIENEGWSSKYIPRLLQTVFHDIVQEEIWNILKTHKNPTIDFKKLRAAVSMQIKAKMPEVFS